MRRTSSSQKALDVVRLLAGRYPEPQTHLVAANAWQLLIAVVLSAQCTDERVNMVTPGLFAKWPDAAALAAAPQQEVEECVRSTGFFRNKAKNIIEASRLVTTRFGGAVPHTMSELVSLPGVARKTANVVLWSAFGLNEGIAVDTHVKRISCRLGLAKGPSVEVIEKELMAVVPRDEWGLFNHRLVWFGRHVCKAQSPLCGECELEPLCPKRGLKK